MLRCGASGASGKPYHLSGFYLVTHLNHVFGLMTVKRLKSVCVLYHNTVAVSVIRSGTCHHSVERRHNLVIRLCLQVHTRMSAPSAIRTDNLGTRQRERPIALIKVGEVELKLRFSLKRVVIHAFRRHQDICP